MPSHDGEVIDMTRGVYRRIYAGFITGERINSVSLSAEAVFWRLHAMADDFGNLEGSPAIIKAFGFPLRPDLTEKRISEYVVELVNAGLITHFGDDGSVGKGKYLHIIGFEARQPAPRNGRRIKRHPAPILNQNQGFGESGGIRGISDSFRGNGGSDTHTDTHTQSHTQNKTGAAPPLGRAKPASLDRMEIPSALAGEDFAAAWADWQADRKERRKPITPRAATLQLAKLAAWGKPKAIEAIRTAITHGWQGLFEPQTPGTSNGTLRLSPIEESREAATKRLVAQVAAINAKEAQ